MGHDAIIRLLLRKGVDKSTLNLLVLHAAISRRNEGIVAQLLDHGVGQFKPFKVNDF
jgi:hypothetical protein